MAARTSTDSAPAARPPRPFRKLWRWPSFIYPQSPRSRHTRFFELSGSKRAVVVLTLAAMVSGCAPGSPGAGFPGALAKAAASPPSHTVSDRFSNSNTSRQSPENALEGILIPQQGWGRKSRPQPLRIKAVGDIMLGRGIGELLARQGWKAVFGPGKEALAGADILAGNLECAISARGNPVAKHYRFRARPDAVAALARAGFMIVSLANNHAMDYGPEALQDTIEALDRAGIAHVGAGATQAEARRPVILERKGQRIAFLAYVTVPVEASGFDIRRWESKPDAPGLALARIEDIREDLEALAGTVDAAIVMIHAGTEGSNRPSALQESLAQAAIEAGALLVIGSHSHVAQGLARYRTGTRYPEGTGSRTVAVAWSLGNWIFDGFEPWQESGAVLDASIGPLPLLVARETSLLLSASLLPKP